MAQQSKPSVYHVYTGTYISEDHSGAWGLVLISLEGHKLSEFVGGSFHTDKHRMELAALKACRELCLPRLSMRFHVFSIDRAAAEGFEADKEEQHVKYHAWKMESGSWNEECQTLARVGHRLLTKKLITPNTKQKVKTEEMKDDKVEHATGLSRRL